MKSKRRFYEHINSKRNGNDRSSTMHNFWTTALLQSVLRIFQDLVEEVRSGKTPIAPESMGNTDAVLPWMSS